MAALSRRSALKIASAFGLSAAAAGLAPGRARAASVDYGVASIDPIYSVAYVTFKKGYFEEAGLSCNYLNTQSGPRGKQMLAAGQIFATTTGASDSIALTIAGKPSKLIFGLDTKITYANLLVRKADYDSGKITKIKDLAGQTIAVTQPQSATWLMATYMCDKEGILKSVDIRGLGSLSTMLGALKSGQVGASIATLGMVEAAVKEGWATPLLDVTEAAAWTEVFGGDVPGLGTYVLQDTIDEQHDQVQAFVSALCKGQDFISGNDAETVAALIHDDYLPSVPMDGLVRTIQTYKDSVWNKTNLISEDAYNRLLAIMGDGRQYSNEQLAQVPYDKAVDMSFIRKARGL